MADPRTVNLQEVIDGHPVSWLQRVTIILCFCVVAVDGFDTAAVGFIAPAIRAEWGMTPAQLGPIFGAGLFGLLVGALALGPFADRFGRKPLLILAVLFFGTASLVSSFCASPTELTAMRFVTGLGLGTAMPCAITLTAEYCPSDRRSRLVTLMFCGFTLGAAFGGLAASQLVVDHGWRSVLVLGGAAPIGLAVILVPALPESIRFLVMRDPTSPRAVAILRRIAPDGRYEGARIVGPARARGIPVAQLFSTDLFRGTLLLWLGFFMSLLVYYLLSNWLPTFINSGGASLRSAALTTILLQIGATIGGVGLGRLMDRRNPHHVLATSYALGAVCVALIGNASVLPGLLPVAVFGAGLGIGGSQTGINALAAAFYPTASRATGVSWANGIGRSGSVLGSLVGGFLLAMDWGFETIFVLAGLPALVASLAMLLKGRAARGTPLTAERHPPGVRAAPAPPARPRW